MSEPISVLLFAYACHAHLVRILVCSQGDHAPLIHTSADGPQGKESVEMIAEKRARLREIDRCDRHLAEQPEDFGRDRDALAGVTGETIDLLQADMRGFRAGCGGTLPPRLGYPGFDNPFRGTTGMRQGIDSIPFPSA